ncbi:glycoside hydrolase family 6 protein [Amnibacterium endophyticum]|uniref:Glucanase n=1 Tax=Amnibacterium endophyticum TaxID=2109337 RepID=A0ABW4LDD0_9MICO
MPLISDPRHRLLAAIASLVVLVPLLAAGPAHAAGPDDPRPYGRFGAPLAVDPHSTAAQQLAKPHSAKVKAAIGVIASRPMANWIGGQSPAEAEDLVSRIVTGAGQRRSVAQLVMFNLPNRTCGRDDHFAVTTPRSYRAWVRGFVRGLGKRRSIVVIEPDSVAMATCLPIRQRLVRYALVAYAVRQVRAQGSWAYIDIGHSKWLSTRVAVNRLRASGIRAASGFSLNVSNFRPDRELIRYGNAISKRVGGRHFVIDSSRNGMPAGNTEWCGPAGKGLGRAPTARTGVRRLDAYLWIKDPGGSDGACNGGPPPGAWYQKYALMLVRNARLR